MNIALMPYVEDDLVGRGVKRLVQSDGQFHHSKVGGQVPAGLGDHVNDPLPQLLAQVLCLAVADPTQGRVFIQGYVLLRVHLVRPASIAARSQRNSLPG